MERVAHLSASASALAYSYYAGAHAGLGDADTALEYTLKALDVSSGDQGINVLSIVTPFWDNNAQRKVGLAYFEKLHVKRGNLPEFTRNWSILAFNEALSRLESRQYEIGLEYLRLSERYGAIEEADMIGRMVEGYVGLGNVEQALRQTLRYRSLQTGPRGHCPTYGDPFLAGPGFRVARAGILQSPVKGLAGAGLGTSVLVGTAAKLGQTDMARTQRAIAQRLRGQ